jgi:carboxylate-amine ligase
LCSPEPCELIASTDSTLEDRGTLTELAQHWAEGDRFGLNQLPAWQPTPPLTVESARRAFSHALPYTLGVEEELMLLDPGTFELAPAIDGTLQLIGHDRRFAPELRAAQIEIVTPVCATVSDACRELRSARSKLVAVLDRRYRLLASGTHPTSRSHGAITDDTRYRQIADEYTFAATRSLVCGMHLHVAVPDAERALAIYNALRSYLPELAALSGNSPFFEGDDTGMSSVRPKFNEIYPRSGIPPAFTSWEELVAFVDWGRRGGLFPDPTHFWWEMRLHPVHGTIELRLADTQTSVDDATAIVTVMHALVLRLADKLDGGEPLPVHDTRRIVENAWRAHRHGVRGWLVDLDSGKQLPTRERLARLLEELLPYAEETDAQEHMTRALTLLAGNGADRQRYVAAHDGVDGLVRWLADETEASALDA